MSRPVKLFVGGLAPDAKLQPLQDAFEKFGKVNSVWLARDPPGFGFIEMDDERDAEDAIRELNGRNVDGDTLRVEFARSGGRRDRGNRDDRGSDRGYDRGYDRDDRGYRGDRGRTDRDVKCFNCNEFGHWARDCHRPVNRGECYNCGRSGH